MDNEQELIRGMQRGDPQAFEAAIQAHHHFLVLMATPLAGPELAKDVAQETWIKAFAAIEQFQGRSKLRTWLARIALNEARAMLRKYKREVTWDAWGADGGSPIEGRFNRDGSWTRPPIRWHHDSPEALLTEEELYQCIREHLHKLPHDQQSVVLLREVAGLDFSEIAQSLKLAEGNVRVLLHRGRQRLHAMLEHFEEVGTC
ncbi:sigma-70 family RNA polymerase sigma factor [Pseudomonas sp. LPB0260]|uniref:RNA polymerase sigma factor n=1 Tax=unclassified Pseudomonas TaxID=196821 RepID=UPI0015C23736|nr:sigma-70 family RNA polymerase sigma factor [Pseudomonas sp. LPB0260]QLC72971.1 sigma-70 family RNA polymerase sigma factor [Pseudomonas sp. LPB0260]QLC75745.1 sigma-70 family RNA polymerase sigma factor [Pseudomonas sp. LPB0260]